MAAEERTEQATARRREEARKRGTVAKSPELVSAAVFLAFVILIPPLSALLSGSLIEAMRVGVASIRETDFNLNAVLRHLAAALLPAARGWLPLLAAGMAVGIAINVLQTGLLVSWFPAKPDFNRVNPLTGFQRLFSSRALVEMVKSTLKLLIIGWVAWSTVKAEQSTLMQTGVMLPESAFGAIARVIHQIGVRVGFLWLVLAAADYFYQRVMTEKSLRMTKEEVKREFKEQEVSPFVKGKMRATARRLARQRQMQDVPKADVVVTNPVTYAVAIRYDAAGMRAPMVIAKGRHRIAQKIREIAASNRIPIVPNPPLARELHATVEIGEEIPSALYQAVAEVLAYVYGMRNRAGR